MTISLRAMPSWLVLVIAGLWLAGCSPPADEPPAPPPAADDAPPLPAPAPEPAPEPAATPAEADEDAVEMVPPEEAVSVDDAGVAQVTIGSTDQMQFTVREFTVEAGQEVELTLIHEGRLAAQVMGHNVVILQPGEDYMAFGGQVMIEGGSMDNDYLPEGMRDRVIAYTRMIGGGETDTIRFTAPDTPGEYPFLCTFPGHFGAMNGVMIVR
ncbi:MAG: Azurin [Gammaproteobacteria bacterium]|nr:MAG: Azurin [Gammaproteobacteria bacterium]